MIRKSRKSCIADMGTKRFQFNESEQLDIYRYVSGFEMTEDSWKKIEAEIIPRFISYSEWKGYVEQKYENYTLEKLEELNRYLSVRSCNSKGYGEYIKLLCSNFLTFIITYSFTGILEDVLNKAIYEEATVIQALTETGIKGLVFLIIILALVWFIIKTMRDFTEANVKEQFYSDYQEIICKMIKTKNKLTNKE